MPTCIIYACIYTYYPYTVLSYIMAQAFISFQQLFSSASERDQQLYKTDIHYLKF